MVHWRLMESDQALEGSFAQKELVLKTLEFVVVVIRIPVTLLTSILEKQTISGSWLVFAAIGTEQTQMDAVKMSLHPTV